MQVQLRIQHVQSGKTWLNPPTEMTAKELEEAKEAIKQAIGELTYIEVDDDILPGDFIRQQCTLRFIFPMD
jgi:hypothetical protein